MVAPTPPPPPPIKEAPLPVRANLRAELAAGYYERGQMDVALQELAEAVKLDPTNPKIYNVYGLVYATLGQDAEAAAQFPQGARTGAYRVRVPAELGLVPCARTARPGQSIPEFERPWNDPLYRTPEIALINAGRCAGSLGENRQAEQFFKRALAVFSPNNLPRPRSARDGNFPSKPEGRLPGSARADEAR